MIPIENTTKGISTFYGCIIFAATNKKALCEMILKLKTYKKTTSFLSNETFKN